MMKVVSDTDTLTLQEWQLVERWRLVPEGPMREAVSRALGAVIGYALEPRCRESQGDGVPCGSHLGACEGCPRCLAILEDVRARLLV